MAFLTCRVYRTCKSYSHHFDFCRYLSVKSSYLESIGSIWSRCYLCSYSPNSHYVLIDIFLAHLTQRVMWAIVTTERPSSVVRPSVNFSHFNQLLWSHRANLNQTLAEWSLDGPLPKLGPVIPTSNQDGRQAKNRKQGGMKFWLFIAALV